MKNTISVSAVITAYNRPDYLKIALESILNQDYMISEVIIVDDFSSEDIETVVKNFGEKKFKYIRLEQNKGANYCRNIGIKKSMSDYIAFIDDDDIWNENKISTQLKYLLSNKANISLCNFSKIGSKLKVSKNKQGIIKEQHLKLGNSFCGVSGVVALRKIMLENLFDASLPCGQDWDLFIRLIKNHEIYYVAEPLFQYRVEQKKSITSNANKMTILQYSERLAAIEKHKEWLGNLYNKRISDYILTNLAKRDRICPWISYSIKKAGLKTTIYTLIKKIALKIFN